MTYGINQNRPLVVDIKRHSLEDGPGIRSVVFFKGCPLRCLFCHNPETQDAGYEIVFSAKDCIGCGACSKVCPEGVIFLGTPKYIDRERCTRCMECVKVCPGNGLKAMGSYYKPETLAEILLRDMSFYLHSGGGVTLSGGECTMYPEYLESLLKHLKAKSIHITLETSGFFNYSIFKETILPYLDLIYYDLKVLDPLSHIKYCGKPNHKIIDNLYRLLDTKEVDVHPRIPIIPDITTTRENLSSILNFLREAGATKVSLLPYNPMGLQMYKKLGKPMPPLLERFMKPDDEREVYSTFRQMIDERFVSSME